MCVNLIEIKKKLDQLAVSLKKQTADENIAKRFREAAFIYVYFLIIQKTSHEDLAGDYYLDRIEAKLDDLFDKYNEKQGEFSNLLNSFIFRSFEFYKKYITKKRKTAIEILARNKLLGFEEEGDDSEDEIEDEELSKRINEKLEKTIKVTNTIKNAFTVFSLKYAKKISEKGIKNLCSIFKIDEEQMRNMISQGLDLIDKNIKEINFHQDRKSLLFINNIELSEKIKELKDSIKTSCDELEKKKIEKELTKLNNRYNKNKKLLISHREKIKKLTELSYRDIANISHIEHKKIRGLYYIAKKELLRIEREIKKEMRID